MLWKPKAFGNPLLQPLSTSLSSDYVLLLQAMAAETLAQLLRPPRATSLGLMPTGNPVLSRAVTPTTLALATRAMATLAATLAGAQPATFQAQRPTGSLVLSMARTLTATPPATKAARVTAATLAQVCLPVSINFPADAMMSWGLSTLWQASTLEAAEPVSGVGS